MPAGFTRLTWDVATGESITCAVRVDDHIRCWGYSEYTPDFIPQAVKLRASTVSAGANHTCAVRGGLLDCVGANDFGQLEEPTEVQEVQQVSAGYNYNCAITNNPHHDILRGLGLNGNGNGQTHGSFNLVNTTYNSPPPKESHDPSGTLHCWGLNLAGQAEVPINFSTHVLTVATSINHTCAIQSHHLHNRLNCWG